jgi:hypothetical protein
VSPVATADPGVRRLGAAAAVLALVPFATAGARAIAGGWYPMSDNAFFALRARDVLTADHPVLGTWSSSSITVGTDINNPGPMLFHWLAVPARLDPAAGMVAGIVVLHAVMVVLAVGFASRRSPAAAGVVAAMSAALAWTMGSEILVEPWQPHSLLPAFLCFLVLVWSLVCGDRLALPAAVAVGSLLVQTHLGYALIVAVLGTVGLVGLVRSGRDHAPADRRRAVAAAALLAIVLWALPLGEQVAGDGNLGRIARSAAGHEAGTVGAASAARVVAATVALPPWWGRPSLHRTLGDTLGAADPDDLPHLPSTGVAMLSLAALAAGLAGAGWLALRRADRTAAAGLGVGAAALLTGLVTVAVVPLGPLGFASHGVRWLWPIGIFVTGALVLASMPPRRLPAVALAATAVLALLAVPTHRQGWGTGAGPSSTDAAAAPVFRDLLPQLDVLAGRGTLLVDIEGLRAFEPYSTPLMLELHRRGIPFVVENPWTLRQVGERRRSDGRADAVVYIADGEAAESPRPGARRVAYVPGSADAAPVGVFVQPLDARQ